jgi:MerR family mercuric resistance operon transcriptional regulator
MEKLTIGQLAKSAGVNLQTIRYYERRGLIPEPPRNESGYRQYSQKEVSRTLFIKGAQGLGFSLKEIEELLSLKMEPGTTCGDVKSRVEAKISDIEEKILALQQIKEALLSLTERCMGLGPVSQCPILEEMEKLN